MSDLLLADVLRGDSQVSVGTAGEVAQQALDGGNGAVGIVAEADCQGFRGNGDER
ncbi:hypothetical protein D3C81_1903880 [compost metagenome]